MLYRNKVKVAAMSINIKGKQKIKYLSKKIETRLPMKYKITIDAMPTKKEYK